MGIADGLAFRTKGQLAIDICTDAYADGVVFDFACGDEVYGNCTQLRQFFEDRQQAYVLRVASTFMLTLNPQTRMTCAKAVALLARDERRWQIRSAGAGSKGQRWYAWAWIGTVSPRHYLLVGRHLTSGDLAFHYCHVPQGQPLTLARLVRAAGLRWPVEETFEFSKDSFGLDQCQARLHTAIIRHTVLVMTALAICAIAAARLKTRTDTQTPPPNTVARQQVLDTAWAQNPERFTRRPQPKSLRLADTAWINKPVPATDQPEAISSLLNTLWSHRS